MPTLSITKTYADGDILTEADLDAIRTSIQTFFNTTGINSANIQAGGVVASNIDLPDASYLEWGTGNDGRIGVVSDDFIIENVTTDKDIIFKASDNAVATEVMRIDGSEATLLMNSKKIQGLASPDLTVGSDAVNVTALLALVPPGSIMAYGAATAPSGWLLCDGSAVSRTTYAGLFAVIAETAGQGDNVTTFNVPDLRGRFIRCWDNGAGRDSGSASRTALNTGGNSGDTIFSLQADEVGPHSHLVPNNIGGATNPGLTNNASDGATFPTNNSTGAETRPKNVTAQYIIKT